MPSIRVHAPPGQMAVSEADRAAMKAVRLKRRIFELIDVVSCSAARTDVLCAATLGLVCAHTSASSAVSAAALVCHSDVLVPVTHRQPGWTSRVLTGSSTFSFTATQPPSWQTASSRWGFWRHCVMRLERGLPDAQQVCALAAL